jgi:hypothetical protein
MGMFDDCGSGLSSWDEDVQDEFSLDDSSNHVDYVFENCPSYDLSRCGDVSFDEEIDDSEILTDEEARYAVTVPSNYFENMSFDEFQEEEFLLEKEINECSDDSSIKVLKSNLASFRASYFKSSIPF